MVNYFKFSDEIFCVGDTSLFNGIDCNPYLLVDGDEAVLIDPGSPLDFEMVFENISSIIPLDKIKYVILHHNDADFCAAVPLLEKKGMKFQIVTTWKTMNMVQFFGIKSEYYLIEEHENKLTLSSGRILEFINTPYLHFAGAFNTYDTKSKVLFSSDLFGALSYNHSVYADESYMPKMLTFHEHYMPSNTVLRPIMDLLLTYDISAILPQHGSIINKDVKKYMYALRTLECGILLTPIKKNLMASGGYIMLLNEVLDRYLALFLHDVVHEVFAKLTVLTFNEEHRISGYEGPPIDAWNSTFVEINKLKGITWITVIEPFIRKLSATYDIPLPDVFHSMIETAHYANAQLTEANRELDQTIKIVQERLIKCPITGLYNEVFLKSLLLKELDSEDWRELGMLALVNIDDFSKFKFQFGENSDKDVLINLAYMLEEDFGSHSVFRLESTDFGIYGKGYSKEDFVDELERFRIDVSNSDAFLTPITVSIGVVFPDELDLDAITFEITMEHYIKNAGKRTQTAKKLGKNIVCYSGELTQDTDSPSKVLIVDSDPVNLDVLRSFISSEGIEVLTATDGEQGYAIAKSSLPKVIISDIVLPKLDGFLLREKLLSTSSTKNIETIFLSYQKDAASVERAMDLGITHYIKKPYLLSELLGIIKRKVMSK